MAESLLSKLGKLETALKKLQATNRQLAERNRELEVMNSDLRRQSEEALAARERAELDIKYLTVSHKLADNPDSLIATRREISGLIRNIDRCLEMLKE